MLKIVEMYHGSKLYGTDTPESDTDIKGVYVPSVMDIVLQRVKPCITESSNTKGKNTSHDTDRDFYSLQRYLQMVAEGHPMALEMLFAPDTAFVGSVTDFWPRLREKSDLLVCKESKPWFGFIRSQVNKSLVKGHIKSARAVLEKIKELEELHGYHTKIMCVIGDLEDLVNDNYASFLHIPNGDLYYFVVCGRKIPYLATIKTAREIVERTITDFETTAGQVTEGSVNWKPLSHAVRLAHEAIEFFNTGKITLPLPNAGHILKIKQGLLPYDEVVQELDLLWAQAGIAHECSKLPAEPYRDFIDGLVASTYLTKIWSAS
jgi:hypothetical protein